MADEPKTYAERLVLVDALQSCGRGLIAWTDQTPDLIYVKDPVADDGCSSGYTMTWSPYHGTYVSTNSLE